MPYFRRGTEGETPHERQPRIFSVFAFFFRWTNGISAGSDRIDIVIGKLAGAILSASPACTAFNAGIWHRRIQADCPYDPVESTGPAATVHTPCTVMRERVCLHISCSFRSDMPCRCTVKPRSRNRTGPVRPKRYNGNTSPGCILPFVH